jgi:hypothetical protein
MSKYIALEGIKEGNKFYTVYTEGEDHTRLHDGTVAYIRFLDLQILI